MRTSTKVFVRLKKLLKKLGSGASTPHLKSHPANIKAGLAPVEMAVAHIRLSCWE